MRAHIVSEAGLQEELQTLKGRLANQSTECRDHLSEVSALQRKLEALSSAMEANVKELADVKQAATDDANSFKAALMRLTEEKNVAANDAESAASELDDLRHKVAEVAEVADSNDRTSKATKKELIDTQKILEETVAENCELCKMVGESSAAYKLLEKDSAAAIEIINSLNTANIEALRKELADSVAAQLMLTNQLTSVTDIALASKVEYINLTNQICAILSVSQSTEQEIAVLTDKLQEL